MGPQCPRELSAFRAVIVRSALSLAFTRVAQVQASVTSNSRSSLEKVFDRSVIWRVERQVELLASHDLMRIPILRPGATWRASASCPSVPHCEGCCIS
jgi:hypothetical protein